jgi:hypothetical protein
MPRRRRPAPIGFGRGFLAGLLALPILGACFSSCGGLPPPAEPPAPSPVAAESKHPPVVVDLLKELSFTYPAARATAAIVAPQCP